MEPKLEVHTFDRKPLIGRRQYYWHAIDPSNGNVMAYSGEGYNNRTDRDKSLAKVMEFIGDANVIEHVQD